MLHCIKHNSLLCFRTAFTALSTSFIFDAPVARKLAYFFDIRSIISSHVISPEPILYTETNLLILSTMFNEYGLVKIIFAFLHSFFNFSVHSIFNEASL